METLGIIYEVDCNYCLKRYTGEKGRKLGERMKENKDDGEKTRREKKKISLSQHMKTTGHSPAWVDVRIIYKGNNWKKRKFQKAARITSYNKEKFMNKKDERRTISNLWHIILKTQEDGKITKIK